MSDSGEQTRGEKVCVSCGRRFSWRRKWEKDWERVKYCSAACRRRGVSDDDRDLERQILDLLRQRGSGKTICPSEAARAAEPDGWRQRMDDVRRAANRLAGAGKIEMTQGGKVVDPSTARGAIRLRLPR